MEALQILKYALLQIIESIDNGNCEMSEEEIKEAVDYLSMLSRKDGMISKYQAMKYLNVSRATFDNYVRAGKIPKGRHVQGFKELFWIKKDLDVLDK